MFYNNLTNNFFKKFINKNGLEKKVIYNDQFFYADIESGKVMLAQNLYQTNGSDEIIYTSFDSRGEIEFVSNVEE